MNKLQLYKTLKVSLLACLLMFIFEIIFYFDEVNNFIENIILNENNSKILIYVIVFFIMYVQVCFIPIPASLIISASIHASLINVKPDMSFINIFIDHYTWIYIGVVILAYMLGAITAYAIGRKFGKKAVLWIAGNEEDYNKWSNLLETKGKLFYFLTILFPIFPDDLICFVVGSVKFNFLNFVIYNFVGRLVGLITMIASLAFLKSSSKVIPYSMIAWGLVTLALFIFLIVIRIKIKNESKTN